MKSASKIKKKASQARETNWTFDKRAPGEKTVLLASIPWGLWYTWLSETGFRCRKIWLILGYRNPISPLCTSRPSSCQLRKCGRVLSPAFKVAKIQRNSLCNTFNLSIRFTAVVVNSHTTASMITCNELLTSMFSYCNILAVSVQINKYSFNCKEWSQLFIFFSWVSFSNKKFEGGLVAGKFWDEMNNFSLSFKSSANKSKASWCKEQML